MFRVCSFDSETFQDDTLNLDIKFRSFSKKLETRFLQHISLLQLTGNSTFSSQIVRYGQTIIGNEKSGPRRCFHIPIMIPYHVYIQFWNSRKKNSNFIFYAYFLKGNFKELPEKVFSARFQLFFHRILKIFL